MAQLTDCLPKHLQNSGFCSQHIKLGTMKFQHSGGRSRIKNSVPTLIHSESEACLGYIRRPCLKRGGEMEI